MKLWLIGALMVAVVAATSPMSADAKRLGGGKAAGLQRNMPARTAPDAPPPKPATPAQGQQATPANAAAATPAPAPKRSWLGPLAGLAAGLGIGALMSHLGLGGAFGNFIMMALLAGLLVFGVMFLLRRFGGGAGRVPGLAGAGAGVGAGSRGGAQVAWPQPTERRGLEPVPESAPAASAPGQAAVVAAGDATATAAATAPVTGVFVPASFDSEGFARTAKMIFIRLQAANDSADLDDLRRFTTPELFASLRLDIAERGTSPQSTDVVKVEADVLDVADEAERQVVSVRFHGQLREEKAAEATAFNEVWHLVKPLDGSRDWAIAGIEQVG